MKILIVEDEWIVAEDIQKCLKGSYSISVASSGEEALEKVKTPETRPDLILMDIVLKGTLNGIEAAHHIRQFDVPVIYLTAYADEETLEQAKMTEPYGYIVKPFEDRELHATIEMALYKHEMEKKVKKSKKWLEKRIDERSRRTEILLTVRQRLQKEKKWEIGLVIIAECMARLGFERCSIFLVNPFKKTLDFLYGTGVDLQKGTSLLLDNTEYFGVRCVLEERTIYVKECDKGYGKQITSESRSFVWVPIIVQNEAFAALAADNVTDNQIKEEDVKDLEILAGICAAFIDRTRMLIEPAPEGMLDTELKHWLDIMEGYIVLEKEPEKSFEMFCDLVTHGVPGFVISREYPEKLKKKYNLVKTPVLWLSRFETGTTINPDSVPKLIYIIRDFTKQSDESVVLLDGLEYLANYIDFKTVLTYLQEIKDIISMNNSRLIIPLHKGAFPAKDFSMLEKEFKIL